MAQPPQEPPHEQECFPLILLRIPTITIAKRMAIRIEATIMVGQSIKKLLFRLFFEKSFYGEFFFFMFVFANQHIDDECEENDGYNRTDDVSCADEPCAELINDE